MKILRTLVALSLANLVIMTTVVWAGTGSGAGAVKATTTPNPSPVVAKLLQRSTAAARPTPRPTQVAMRTPSPATPAPTPDSRCIIMLDGAKYDITQFRFSHSGGNVFTCSTDMSQIFHSRHGAAEMQFMQQYRI